jgi:hypothetical protein
MVLAAPTGAATRPVITAGPRATAPVTHYELALGDSPTVGYRPNAPGVGHETTQG